MTNIFGNNPEYNDQGELLTFMNGNLAAVAVVDVDDVSNGSIVSMNDTDVTTYIEIAKTSTSHTLFLELDLLERYKDVVITIYYSCFNGGGGASSNHTCQVQTSINGTDWTVVDTITNNAASTEVFQNYSALTASIRYLRFRENVPASASANRGSRIYWLQIRRKGT